MRINKYLALCGQGSRRKSENLILEGRVKLNGREVNTLSVDINPEKDMVAVDGKKISPIGDFVYLMLNKPKGYITTTSDEFNRPTVMELIKLPDDRRVYPVGRLDYETEGLLLFTDDGDLANILTHPSHNITKTYIARIKGATSEKELDVLRTGVVIDDNYKTSCQVKILSFDENSSRLELIITEGKNRQIRKMLESIGKEVEFLKRTHIGEIHLGGLTRGKFRMLNNKEINYLLCLKDI